MYTSEWNSLFAIKIDDMFFLPLDKLDGLSLTTREWDVAQAVKHSAVKVWILRHGGLILHGGCICSLGYFPF